MFYTYLLNSKKNARWYTGYTKDLRKRLEEHNDNKVFSTKGRGPFELIYYEACLSEQDAIARERYLKSGMGKRYLKNRLRRFLSLTGFTSGRIMRKRAQTLIVSLWILVILTFLAIGIGQRVSMALRLSRYHRDKLKASCLAKAGLNMAIAQLEKDTNGYDALNETRTGNENEFTTVGVSDEERKININTASKELLAALLEQYNINASGELVDNILIWRGDIPDAQKIYELLGYPAKAARFTNSEELRLIKGITSDDYQKIKQIITVYGDVTVNGKASININTASIEVLNIFSRGIAKSLGIEEKFADSLIIKINELRNNKGPFKDKGDITVVATGSEELNIFNNLVNSVVFQSNFFLIEVTGNVGKIKDKVKAVYNRLNNTIAYWHES